MADSVISSSLESPWKVVDLEVAERMPAFAFIELVWGFLSVLCLIHACSQPSSVRSRHVFLCFVAVCAGTANDLIFTHLPLVDNFFHSQATMMLTSRVPAYILCVYQVFLYVPTAFLWRMKFSMSVLPPLTAFLAVAFYAPFDIVGAKFIWWTWHDSDNNTNPRLMGVPVSSTMWVGVFSFVYSYLLNHSLPPVHAPVVTRTPPTGNNGVVSIASFTKAFAVVVILSVPLMMIHMALIQSVVSGSLPPELPGPNVHMLVVTVAFYSVLLLRGLTQSSGIQNTDWVTASGGTLLQTILVIHYVSYILIAKEMLGGPEQQVSVGIHQSVGPCDELATDYSGFTRRMHVCESTMTHREAFAFVDIDSNTVSAPIQWYAIRGTPSSSTGRNFLMDVFHVVAVGVIFFWFVKQLAFLGTTKVKAM